MGVLQRADVVENLLRLGGSGQHGGHLTIVQQPCQAHLGQRLAAFGGQIVQIHDLLVQFLGQSGIVEESRIVSHAAVGRNAVEIAVGQQALCQRAEGDEALAQLEGGLLQTVLLDGAVEDVVFVLVDDERHVQFCQNCGGLFHRRTIVVGQTHVQGLAGVHGLSQRAHRLLKRGFRIRVVVVEDVHIIQAQAFQRLVEAGEQVLAAAEVAIGACPHFIAGLGGDDEFVAVMLEVLGEQQSAVLLGLAGFGAVVVG